ncbi:MAG: cyclic nucleotide-binding domain-containing protein [candidate division Zixibacteria bacterium]|nr:cyclic nucleotide-binding domain-containing protein [Candidatus Tariuqbacter arcticus]
MQKVKTDKAHSELLHYSTGEIVLKEGQGSSVIYILRHGKLGVYKGDNKVAELSDDGLLFGEMSSILGKPRTCTIKAEVDSDVMLYRGGVHSIVKRFPSITEKILIVLAERLDDLNEKYSAMQSKCEFLARELDEAKTRINQLTGEKEDDKVIAAEKAARPEHKIERKISGETLGGLSDGDLLGRRVIRKF